MYMLIKGPRAWQCQCCMRRPMYAGACLYRFARYIYIGVKCHMTSSSKDTPPLTQTAKVHHMYMCAATDHDSVPVTSYMCIMCAYAFFAVRVASLPPQ